MKKLLLCLLVCRFFHVASLASAPLGLHTLADGSDLIVVATFTEYEPVRGWIQYSGPVHHPGETYSVDVTDYSTIKIFEVLKGKLPRVRPLHVLLPHQGLVTFPPAQPPAGAPNGSITIDPVVLKKSAEPSPLVGTTHLLFLQRLGQPFVDRGFFSGLPSGKRIYRWQTADPAQHLHSNSAEAIADLRNYFRA